MIAKTNKKWISTGATLILLTGTAAAKEQKPNVLLILADDMGYGDTGFNGCKEIPTPNIDSIASNGVRFVQGYVSAPQCAPSRAGLLSGMSQSRFGREENTVIDEQGIPPTIKRFGDYMREAGYRTGMVGKWHQGTSDECHPLERGFDWFFGFLGGGSRYFPAGRSGTIDKIFENRDPATVTNYLTFAFGDKAMEFIRQKSDKPFFLYLAFNAPHVPQEAPKEYIDRFEFIKSLPDPTVYKRKQVECPRQMYAAMVSALDDTIGRVLKTLRDNGMEKNTLIYFLSDNGGPTGITGARNGPLRGVKGDVLEGGIRVPFAMQWKGTIPDGQIVNTPVSSLDLLPTALSAAGASVPSICDGKNLLPMLIQGENPGSRTLFWRFPHPPKHHVWGIRSGEWKLVDEAVRNAGGGFSGEGKIGLYRIVDDVDEATDLSAQYPEIRQKLQVEYDAWTAKIILPEQ